MRRRDFVGLLGGAAAGFVSFGAFSQQNMRRIAVVIINGPDEPLGKDHIAAFRKRLAELGWIEGRNIAVEYRFSGAATPIWCAPMPLNSSHSRPT